MNLKEILKNLDTKEPVLVEWALDRIEDKKDIDPEAVEMIESQVFNDDSLQDMIDHFDSWLLTRIFQTIPAKKFSNHINMLIQKWQEWNDTVAERSAVIIAQNDPAVAAEIFSKYCENNNQFDDFKKWHGIFKSLDDLSEKDSKHIAEIMTDSYINLLADKKRSSVSIGLRGTVKESYSFYILELAWRFDFPEFETLLYQSLAHASKSPEKYSEDIIRIVKILGLSAQDCQLIFEFINGYSPPMPGEFRFFYHETIPFDEFDDGVNNLKKNSLKFIPSFFDKYKDVIKNEKIKALFHQLLEDKEFLGKLDKKEKMPYIYGMIFSALLSSLKKDKLDLSGCSIAEAVKLLSTDIETLPDMESFFSFFRNQDKKQVVKYLTEAAEKNAGNYGAIHILQVMGELGYDEFLKPLTDALSSGSEYDDLYEITENILLKKYRNRAICFFKEYFSKIDEMGKISVLNIARKLGTPESVELIDNNFDIFWKIEKEFILEVCQALCSEKYLERLKPKVNKQQYLIDDAYLIISLLTGKKRTPEIKSLLSQYHRRKAEQHEMIKSVQSGRIADTAKPYIDAELECKKCGDKYVYRLTRVIVGDKGKPYIAQEIECLNCHALSEFEFTPRGMMGINAEMMRQTLFKSDKKSDAKKENQPLHFVKSVSFGKQMDIEEAVSNYQKLIKKNPADASNYIGLGNIYYNTEQPTKAGECYHKAIENDPSYLQAYYTLAQIADNSGDPEKAIALLEQGTSYFSSWKYKGSSGITQQDFTEGYCELYNSLIRKRRQDKPKLRPADLIMKAETGNESKTQMPVRTEKIGRNDPCPCGSGKKYKKCCLNK